MIIESNQNPQKKNRIKSTFSSTCLKVGEKNTIKLFLSQKYLKIINELQFSWYVSDTWFYFNCLLWKLQEWEMPNLNVLQYNKEPHFNHWSINNSCQSVTRLDIMLRKTLLRSTCPSIHMSENQVCETRFIASLAPSRWG